MSRAVKQIKLTEQDRTELENLGKKKSQRVSPRVLKHAMVLLKSDEGKGVMAIAEVLDIDRNTVRLIKNRYLEHGLQAALFDLPRPGKKPLLGEKEKACLLQMCREAPPAGYARWSHRLLAQEMIKRKIVEKMSQDVVRRFLKKKGLSLVPKKAGAWRK